MGEICYLIVTPREPCVWWHYTLAAHSVLISAVAQYAEDGEDEDIWSRIYREPFDAQSAPGNICFTYVEVYAFVMACLIAHRQSTWAQHNLGKFDPSGSASVQEVRCSAQG